MGFGLDPRLGLGDPLAARAVRLGIRDDQAHIPGFLLWPLGRILVGPGLSDIEKITKGQGDEMTNPIQTKRTSKKRKRERIPESLETKELAAILDAPSERSVSGIRARCILGLMGKCGLRVSEVTELLTTSVRLDADIPFVKVIGKGDKERRAFLGGGMVDLLRHWIKIRPTAGRGRALFPVIRSGRRGLGVAKPGRKMSPRSVRYMVKRYARDAGIERWADIHPHTLRHTAATLALKAGENLRKIQKMLGHANIATVQIYTHIHDAELAEMADRLDPGKAVDLEKLNKDLADLMARIQKETGGNNAGV
jgi:site-specific recombinase XerD